MYYVVNKMWSCAITFGKKLMKPFNCNAIEMMRRMVYENIVYFLDEEIKCKRCQKR